MKLLSPYNMIKFPSIIVNNHYINDELAYRAQYKVYRLNNLPECKIMWTLKLKMSIVKKRVIENQ